MSPTSKRSEVECIPREVGRGQMYNMDSVMSKLEIQHHFSRGTGRDCITSFSEMVACLTENNKH